MNIIILFILIYIITLILFGVFVYIDMDKGETLEHYCKDTDMPSTIFLILFPFVNTFILILCFIILISKKLWNKIKYCKK